MPVVVATIYPLPEYRDEVIAIFVAGIPAVHAEPGCILYALHDQGENLVMVEQWASQEALDAHSQGEALRAIGAQLRGKVSQAPQVLTMEPVPAGDGDKGMVRPAGS